MPDSEAPKVFISYSHDSDVHRECILQLSDKLRDDGVDCLIDQYINGAPKQNWQRWMESNIEQADFVLVVCTEKYLKRFKGEDEEGGRGVNFEGVVITQMLYDAFQKNTKFLPVIPDDGDINHVPLIFKGGSTHQIGKEYESIYRVLTNQPRAIAKPLGKRKHFSLQQNNHSVGGKSIQIDRLPTVAGEFFGRETELQMLDNALANDNTRILQFIASGGTGKTKLIRHWLNQQQEQGSIDNYIVWSFYSQGTSESKSVSATPLIIEVFKALELDYEGYTTDEDRIDTLIKQLEQHRCVWVLDGLEPLQHGGEGFDGQLKDRAIKRLLSGLLSQADSLCIITSRIPVYELSDKVHVKHHSLQNIEIQDGVKLLRSLGVHAKQATPATRQEDIDTLAALALKPTDHELTLAVREYGQHALAVNLLGNILKLRYQGDVLKRQSIKALVKPTGNKDSQHAFRVMQAYEYWFAESTEHAAELALLRLLGLFDHPIEQAVLQTLWEKQIAALTADIDEDDWLDAIGSLRDEYGLLSKHGERPDLLDCHPLIREYFGKQLEQQQPEAWQAAHETLYHYYQAIPEKEQPDNIDEMQPLFHAVSHGCAAGLHQQALGEVYWPRIQRSGENYLCNKHGAFSDDLAAVAHFFSQPWRVPAAGLTDADKAVVLNWAGFRLRALGRLSEAVEPMEVNIELFVEQENWIEAALGASNLSEVQLPLGRVAAAVDSGERSVVYADQSGDMFQRMGKRTTHADALHQAGQSEFALELFAAAEQLQREHQPEYPRLYSLPGFRYCDLLLAQGRVGEVLERAEEWLDDWETKYTVKSLLGITLIQLSLGRAHHAQGDLPQARDWLDQAVAGLRKAGQNDYLARGLLARAALWRDLASDPAAQAPNHYARARRDLDEVWEIAEAGEMKLHLTDYHLEMARLLLAQFPHPNPSPGGRGALTGDIADDETNDKNHTFSEQEATNNGTLNHPSPSGRGAGSEGNVQQHVKAATALIQETGYHRRDKELQELQNQLKQP